MAKRNPPSHLREPVHVVQGSNPPATLRQCGGREAIVLHDPVGLGPCDVNPVRHHRLRQSFWRDFMQGDAGAGARGRRRQFDRAAAGLLSAGDLTARLSAYPPDRPVVLWTAPSLPDRLAFWWVLDALQRSKLERGRFWVAEPDLAGRSYPRGDQPAPSMEECLPRTFHAAFAGLRPLAAKTVRAGAALWRHFARISPVGFGEARRRGSSVFPDLGEIAQAYGGFFPRVTDRGTLKLSDVDQLLLDALDVEEWRRPADLIRNDFRTVLPFMPFGDLFLTRRLREWAGHSSPEPALLARPEPDGRSEFADVAYRLTRHGDRLRRRGLGRPDDAPATFIGGWHLYARSPTWARRDQGGQWRIESLNG